MLHIHIYKNTPGSSFGLDIVYFLFLPWKFCQTFAKHIVRLEHMFETILREIVMGNILWRSIFAFTRHIKARVRPCYPRRLFLSALFHLLLFFSSFFFSSSSSNFFFKVLVPGSPHHPTLDDEQVMKLPRKFGVLRSRRLCFQGSLLGLGHDFRCQAALLHFASVAMYQSEKASLMVAIF